MKDGLLQKVKDFLSQHYVASRPILLGISGGTDSLALLHLLLECKRFLSIDLHLAHLDHGWREESQQEAFELQRKANELGLPFHTRRIVLKGKGEANLEEKGRKERIAFFQEVYLQIQAQALILAHQQNDQAETVLKRIFEGAHLFSVDAMQPVSSLEQMTVWRPLLSIDKEDLAFWLQKRGLQPFDDVTNRDPKFLRARMREFLIPVLEQQFGKSISSNICRLAEDVSLCKQAFQAKFEEGWNIACHGKQASFFDYRDMPFSCIFEIQSFLKLFLNRKGGFPSREVLHQAAQYLQNGAANKTFWISGKEVLVDRYRLILIEKDLPRFSGKNSLEEGFLLEENGHSWEARISIIPTIDNVERLKNSSWKECLSGQAFATFPYEESLEVLSLQDAGPKVQRQAKERFVRHSVPFRLRSCFPLIVKNEKLICDFLSGEIKNENLISHGKYMHINIKIFKN